jgi:hypothetical protein
MRPALGAVAPIGLVGKGLHDLVLLGRKGRLGYGRD